ncbi:MAG: hydrogenase maturation protease [Alphaproteobacteria bacterium]|nr:hydrogenase maturation protease [Alphaproteobacteria bacterium]
MKRILFLGVGNLHRADDGVGPALADMLTADAAFMAKGIEVQPHSGEGASLIHLWMGADKVVIVDAMKSGLRCGTIKRFDAAHEALHHGVFRYSSHLFSLAEAVEMSRTLGTLPPEMIVYGIEGKEFTFGAAMSPSVVRALKKVEATVRDEFADL